MNCLDWFNGVSVGWGGVFGWVVKLIDWGCESFSSAEKTDKRLISLTGWSILVLHTVIVRVTRARSYVCVTPRMDSAKCYESRRSTFQSCSYQSPPRTYKNLFTVSIIVQKQINVHHEVKVRLFTLHLSGNPPPTMYTETKHNSPSASIRNSGKRS